MRMTYAIKFVADMDRAVSFHRDVLQLPLKFQSPFWSEFSTGDTTLALHPASDKNPAGSVQLGFSVDDLNAVYSARDELGLTFAAGPRPQQGGNIARFLDSENTECSLSG